MSHDIETSVKFNKWWRWLLLPFACIFGFMLASMAAFVFLWLAMKLQGGYSSQGWWAIYIMPTIISAIGGYAYAYIAYEMAPAKKFIACALMTAILVVISIAGIFYAWATQMDEPIQLTIGMIAESVTSIGFLKAQYR